MRASLDNGFAPAEADDHAPVRIGVVGAGRIGRLHAELLSREVPGATVAAVADTVWASASALAVQLGTRAVAVEDLLSDPDVDAIAICTSTDTHVEFIQRAAAAGKAIFSEKPVSLDLSAVDRALSAVAHANVPFMVGFNKRFDPAHAHVRDTVRSGELGPLHLLRITGRDPAPPPPEYVAVSGGLFLDMTIHDFDMARFVAGSEVIQVFATGAVRVDARIGEAGDIDTAVIVLAHADGAITTIDNSRRAVYGYDQRVEAFCAEGMAFSGNAARHTAGVIKADGRIAQPLGWSFLDRYREAYRREWVAFVTALRDGTEMPVDTEASRAPIVIALAANRSLALGRPVATSEVN